MSIEITGGNAVLSSFDDLADKINQRVQAAIENAAQSTYDASQAAVPVDTGELKSSGKIEHGELTSSVSYGTDHNWFIELGTRKQAAQPFLFPAFEQAKPKLEDELRQVTE